MHQSSFDKMKAFRDGYLAEYRDSPLEILDFGSRVASPNQPNYRPLFDAPAWRYTGMDIEPGENVDVAVRNPYDWTEIPGESFDVAVSGQTLEHVKFFWVTMFEIVRTLKEGGLACLIAPGAGVEHRFPVDCWRFYRDGMAALCEFAGARAVEVYTQWKWLYYEDGSGAWRDSCVVLQKPRLADRERRRFHERVEMQKRVLAEGAGGWALAPPPSAAPDRRAPSAFPEMASREIFPRLEREREDAARRRSLPLRGRAIRKGWKSFVRSFTQPLGDGN
ncbi:MAG: class I SAM-dependent methyltransferase [Deltaproteobacteria bacterium]|nr:class I SAM-dependent methyltransferase [Deltaproteobacteria bacterium]